MELQRSGCVDNNPGLGGGSSLIDKTMCDKTMGDKILGDKTMNIIARNWTLGIEHLALDI
ncbi:MAG: hypothetical protein NTX50_19355 [Candidatus Sumerlaeota bacterium]|nr:hypothetical protein [Candidatus Sumerlaeota bacterium]